MWETFSKHRTVIEPWQENATKSNYANNHFPVTTIFIIVLNGIIFAFGLLSGVQTRMIQNYGFIPNQIFNVQNEQQNALTSLLQSSEPHSSLSLSSVPDSLARLFASMFVHANIVHIAFNLVALAYLGVHAERAIGVPRIGIS